MSRPSLTTAFVALLRRDFLLAYRRRAELLQPLVFLLVVITLFPLGVGPSPQLLASIAAGVIWIAALLATVLSLDSLFRSSANLWQIGADALGPIFTGGRLESGVAAAEAVQRQTLERYLDAIQTAFREVDDALVSVAKYRTELAARGRQVAALRTYAAKARLRYAEGYVSYIEVLDAERRLFDVALLHAQARADLYAALVSLYKALGGGWIDTADALRTPATPTR